MWIPWWIDYVENVTNGGGGGQMMGNKGIMDVSENTTGNDSDDEEKEEKESLIPPIIPPINISHKRNLIYNVIGVMYVFDLLSLVNHVVLTTPFNIFYSLLIL